MTTEQTGDRPGIEPGTAYRIVSEAREPEHGMAHADILLVPVEAGEVPAHEPTGRADLETEYRAAIAELDAALRDATEARRTALDAEQRMAVIEARATMAATGANTEQRKAAVTLALADDADYQQLAATVREARDRLADADRRATVAKETCRLLRATLAVPTD